MKKIITSTPLSTHLAHSSLEKAILLSEPVELASDTKSENGAPEFIQVFPKGPKIDTTDGRSFKISDPEALASRLNASGKSILIDYDHKSHYDPEKGGDQTAAGWMVAFEVRDGALWAKVDWTAAAALKISNREYRFFSPEFNIDKKTNEVIEVIAAGVVNRPAFEMTALAAQQLNDPPNSNEDFMFTQIAKKLGLPEDASEQDVLAAIEKKDADHGTELATAKAQASTPSTDDFMPRADYDVVLASRDAARDELSEIKSASFKTKVDETITAAVEAGKITPGSKDHYVALCSDQKQFEKVVEAIGATLPVAQGSGIEGQPDDKSTELTAEEQSIASSLGISEKDFAAHKASQAA